MAKTDRFKLIILEQASEDMIDLYNFYEGRVKGSGDEFIDNLGNCLVRLEENPKEWQYAKTAAEKIRRGIVKKPQVIFLYLVEGTEVRITTIKDSNSDWLSNL